MSEDFAPPAEDAAAERWAWLVWGALVAIFEAFQQPALLGATIGLKFAWADVRTGWWLWGRDPDRRRGQSHFWTYLGFGLWKSALVGIVLSLAFAVALAQFRNPKPNAANPGGNALALVLTGSCLSGVFTALLAAAVTSVGLVKAYAGGRKLWLNSALAAARVRGHWPPDYGDRNRLALVALPSALVVVSLLVGAVFVLVAVAMEPAGKLKDILACVGFAGGFLGVPVIGLLVNDVVKRRLTASSTLEAWPDESGEGG